MTEQADRPNYTNKIAAFMIVDPWGLKSQPPVKGLPASFAAALERWPDAHEDDFKAAVALAAPLIRAAGENELEEADALDQFAEALK